MRTTRSGCSAWTPAKARLFVLVALLAIQAHPPPAHGGPLECADPCEIKAFQAGYLLPVTQIASGTQVLWGTAETSHPTSNSLSAQRCFVVPVGASVVPVPVQFDVVDGEVLATTAPATPKQAGPTACGNAIALPTGAYAMPYGCLLHPWMNGILLIEP